MITIDDLETGKVYLYKYNNRLFVGIYVIDKNGILKFYDYIAEGVIYHEYIGEHDGIQVYTLSKSLLDHTNIIGSINLVKGQSVNEIYVLFQKLYPEHFI